VRRLKYLDRHTEPAGSGFDYHGDPVRILIGRVIAVALRDAYQFGVRSHSPRVVVVVPALLAAALRKLAASHPEGGSVGYLASHPPTAERLGRLDRLAKTYGEH
jgi:Zn-dependent protease with chaperone function